MLNPIELARFSDVANGTEFINDMDARQRERELAQASRKFIFTAGNVFLASYIPQGIIAMTGDKRPRDWNMRTVLHSGNERFSTGEFLYDEYHRSLGRSFEVTDRPLTDISVAVYWTASGELPVQGSEHGGIHPWNRAMYEFKLNTNLDLTFVSGLNSANPDCFPKEVWMGNDTMVGTLLELMPLQPKIETVNFRWAAPGHVEYNFGQSSYYPIGDHGLMIPCFDQDFLASPVMTENEM